jgi:hypothetical protein
LALRNKYSLLPARLKHARQVLRAVAKPEETLIGRGKRLKMELKRNRKDSSTSFRA